MSTQDAENRLTSLLRQGDPLVEDPGLSPLERAEIRRVVLARVPERTRRWQQLSPALSVAVLLLIALGITWWPSTTHQAQPGPRTPREATVSRQLPSAETGIQESGNPLETRKIQFETPGGTLVVWVLNPNFPS